MSDLERVRKELVVSSLRNRARLSRADGCEVVDIACDSCGRQFVEELDSAIVKVATNMPLQCLQCDREAGESSKAKVVNWLSSAWWWQ